MTKDDWANARAIGTLSAAGVSIVLFVAGVASPAGFIASNKLSATARDWLLAATIGSALAGPAFVVVRRGDPQVWSRARAYARAATPVLLLGLLPGVFSRSLWNGAELPFLFFLGAIALVIERFVAPLFAAGEVSAAAKPGLRAHQELAKWLARGALVGAVLYYALTISRLTILSHHRLATSHADLAEFDNLFFNALNGHPFRAPATDGSTVDFSALKVHAEFLLYLLLPFYATNPGPEALLVLQSVHVAATAIPLYLFASRRVGELAALCIGVAFLLMPAVQQPNFYDFHFVPIGMHWVMWTLYFADRCATDAPSSRRRPRSVLGFCISFALALLAREDFSFGLAVLCAVLAGNASARKLGIAGLVIATGWLVLMKVVVMPHFGTMWFSSLYETLKAAGNDGYAAVLTTLATNPAFVVRQLFSESRLLYLMHLLVPLLFLWVRHPWLLLAALPGLPFTLLATDRPPLHQISFQYVYHWIPYIFSASVLALERITAPGRRMAAVLGLTFASVASSYHYGAFLGADSIAGGFSQKKLSITKSELARYDRLRLVIRRIPAGASVAATDPLGPHVSTRLDVFALDTAAGQGVDYILLDLRQMSETPLADIEHLSPGQYAIIKSAREFVLLGKQTQHPGARPAVPAVDGLAGELRKKRAGRRAK